jgi:hypothetical protein
MHALHAQYGPVVRYSPNDLSYVDEGTTAWKAIHNQDKTGKREFPKAREWFVTPANGSYSIFFFSRRQSGNGLLTSPFCRRVWHQQRG